MSEGPVSFGKPLAYLILLGMGGGGYYYWSTAPVTFEGPRYAIKLPHAWTYEAKDLGMAARGPLKDETAGAAWSAYHIYGTLIWPEIGLDKFPKQPDAHQAIEQDGFKAILVTYVDGPWKYRGIAVARPDSIIVYAIGCPSGMFEKNKDLFEKSVRSLECAR
jgi:hypothetical protein